MDVWLKRLSDEMEGAVAGLSPEQLELRPSAEKWNIGNILEHLARAFGGTAKSLEEKLALPSVEFVPPPTFQQRIAIFAVTAVGFFPNGRKAPTMVEPSGWDGTTALARFRENLERMDLALSAAEKRWGGIRVSVHPIIGPLTAHQWRRFHYIHTHHHVKQVRALRPT